MIAIQAHPLPPPDREELKRWLQDPACIKFQNYLAAKASEEAAKAGNCLIAGSGTENNEEAADYAKAARMYQFASTVITEIRNSGYTFEIPDLKPKPQTLPEHG